MRKRRSPSVEKPKFIYEEHGLRREDVPLFMVLVLDENYVSIFEKEKFLQDFGYRYLDDEEFRKEVDGYVIVFEDNRYVGYDDKSTYNRLGNPGRRKHITQIGKLPMIY